MSNMLEEIHGLPDLISTQVSLLDQEIRGTFSHREILQVKEVVLTGCGDSLFAGYGVRHFFQRICNLPTRALPAMEASRYDLLDYKSAFPRNPLVIAISVSGEIVRTIEAVETANSAGASTLAITSVAESRLARTAEKAICFEMPVLKRSPGVMTYRASLIAMYLVGIHFAEVLGKLTSKSADGLRTQLIDTSLHVRDVIRRNSASCEQLAETLKDHRYFVFIGDGPNLASAMFSAAKVIEATGFPAVGQNTEEWAHLQYFELPSCDVPTFVLGSRSRGYSRLVELLEPLKRTGRMIIAVAPEGCAELQSAAAHVITVGSEVQELYAPMVFPVGCELFSAYLAEIVGATYYRENLPTYPRGANTIRTSALESVTEISEHD